MSLPWQEPLDWTDPDGDTFKIHTDEPGQPAPFATIEVHDVEENRTVGVYIDEIDAAKLVDWLTARLRYA